MVVNCKLQHFAAYGATSDDSLTDFDSLFWYKKKTIACEEKAGKKMVWPSVLDIDNFIRV